eukprot:GEMP01013589.1.p1 GENE.GEMP01013589.1~~GEMP01013589.1.p1  ORF type:complete len:709 (+),score=201.81 GEMP01013589.1:301-2427(+)
MRRTPPTSRYNYNYFARHFDDSPRDYCADAPTCAALHRSPRRAPRDVGRPYGRVECEWVDGWDLSASGSDCDISPPPLPRFACRYAKKRSRWRSPPSAPPQPQLSPSTARNPWARQQPMEACWATSSPEPQAFGALYPCARCGHQDPFGVDELNNEYSRRFEQRAPCCGGDRCETLLERLDIQQELCRIEREQCTLMRQQYKCDQMKLNLERDKLEMTAHQSNTQWAAQQDATNAQGAALQQQQQQQKDGIFDGVASKLVQIMNDYVEIIPQTGNQLGFKFRNAAGLGPQMQPSARPCTMTPQQYEYAHPQPVLWHGLANNYVHGPHAHQPVCTYAVPETAPRRNVWWQSDAPLPIAVSGSGRAYSPPVADIPILRHTNRRGITLDPRPGPMRQCDAVRSALARARPERTPRDPGRRTNVTDQAKNASDAANVWSSEAPSGGVQIDDARSGDARSGDARSGDARSDGARSAALEPPQRQTRSTESSAKVVSTGKHVKVPRVASGGTVGMQVQRTATAQSDKSHERQSWRVSQGMDYKSKVSHRSSDLPAQPMPRARMARRKTRMAPVAQLGGIASASVSAGELDIIVASSAAEPDTSAASVGAEPDISAASAGSEPDISAASVGHGPGTSVASGMLALPPVPAPVGGRRRRRPTTTAPPVMGPQRNSDGDIISPAELEEAGWFASTPGGGESQENADEDAGAGVGWFG